MNAAGSPQEQFRDCRKIPAKLRFFGNCNSHLGIVIPRTPIWALGIRVPWCVLVFYTRCKNYHDTKASVASMHAAGVGNVHFLDLAMDERVLNETTGFIQGNAAGCANHPSWIRNDMMAAIAAPKVKATLGWE